MIISGIFHCSRRNNKALKRGKQPQYSSVLRQAQMELRNWRRLAKLNYVVIKSEIICLIVGVNGKHVKQYRVEFILKLIRGLSIYIVYVS